TCDCRAGIAKSNRGMDCKYGSRVRCAYPGYSAAPALSHPKPSKLGSTTHRSPVEPSLLDWGPKATDAPKAEQAPLYAHGWRNPACQPRRPCPEPRDPGRRNRYPVAGPRIPFHMISIVLPARNEAAALRNLLPRLKSAQPDAEILIVDDGSTDDTAALCREHGVTCLSSPYSMGNGAAIKRGARAAHGDILVFMDADGQHDPADI